MPKPCWRVEFRAWADQLARQSRARAGKETLILFAVSRPSINATIRLEARLHDPERTDRSDLPTWSHTGPDQPPDLGTLSIGGARHEVIDCIMGAIDDHGRPYLGADIPVRRNTPGWTWVVAHMIEGHPNAPVGATVTLNVDAQRRTALSVGHTACELATLAINRALAEQWRTEVPLDQLGSPAFESLAIATSRILPYGSRDEYRLGKSLRKRGFVAGDLCAKLEEIEHRVETTLNDWALEDAPV